MMMTVQQTAPFSGLLLFAVSRYSFPAVAKSAAGRENPSMLSATYDAPCVFFCVYAYVHLLFTHRFLSRCCICVMVAQAGQPSGWPVSNKAGIPTPVRVTTHERRNSGGGNYRYLLEVAPMATTLTLPHPQFVFVFAAVRRADRKPRICML
ncbi:ash family protein, partial [Salmonella enterica subsp. enterica serovar Derby]|nr:ash family protein [Salmonella enterica subsp. enterica serovar Derby]